MSEKNYDDCQKCGKKFRLDPAFDHGLNLCRECDPESEARLQSLRDQIIAEHGGHAIVEQEDLTIGHLRSCGYMVIMPNKNFFDGIIVDNFTKGGLCKIYDALGEANQARFREHLKGIMFLQLLDKMWEILDPKKKKAA